MKGCKNWLPQQDQALLELRLHRRIQSWATITSLLAEQFNIPNKSPKKCRERFNNHLDPLIRRQQWTDQEEDTLLALHQQLGNRWALISRHLPGRTDNTVKNKLYSKYRRALRNLNALMRSRSEGRWREMGIGFVYKLMLILEKGGRDEQEGESEVARVARVIKNEIITFEHIAIPTNTPPEELRIALDRLASNVQWLNLNFKKRSLGKRTAKDSSAENTASQKQPLPPSPSSPCAALPTTDCEPDRLPDLSAERLPSAHFLPQWMDRPADVLPISWEGVYGNQDDHFWDVQQDSYSF